MRLFQKKSILKYSILLGCALLLVALGLFSSVNFFSKSNHKVFKVTSLEKSNHQKMISMLAEVAQKINTPRNGYAGEVKLAYCESLMQKATTGDEQLTLAVQKGVILLEIGREPESVAMLERAFDFVKTVPESRATIGSLLGLAYLRLGERQNCIVAHGSESCIMPIQGNGVHSDKTAAEKAVVIFEEVMTLKPDDLDTRWMLNIAYMTLGKYPNEVPKKWLIAGLEESGTEKMKPFLDMAGDLGLNVKNRAGGSIVEDFNNDGYLDIISSAWGLDDPMHYFQNNGDGSFTDLSKESGLSQLMGGLNLVQTDYNNDGLVDVFVLRGAWQGVSGFGEQPNSLLRNNGDGSFTDVTIQAGLLNFKPTQTATWNDFNNDGWLDLFIGNESTNPQSLYACDFFINNQDGTFTNIASKDFEITLFVKGVTSGDYDNDGWADIFLSCLSGQKVLLRNKGVAGKTPSFEIVSTGAGLAETVSGTFPTFFFDYDNDGFLDLFMCNYEFNRPLSYYAAKEMLHSSTDRAGKIYMYHNNKDGTFTDLAPKMGVNQTVFAMGANFGDFDNDGWLDMYLATGNPNYQSLVPNKMYKNLSGKDFADVTTSARVGNLQKGHAVSIADLNNNGDQDIYVDMGGAYRGDAYHSSFYLNPGQNNNNWINIKLEGTKSNRVAIGARLQVKFRENGVERTVFRDVNSGGSFGCSPLRREIGLGQATEIDELTIIWPASGTKQVFKNVKPNQFIKIVEGKEDIEKLDIKPLIFKKSDGSIPMCRTIN